MRKLPETEPARRAVDLDARRPAPARARAARSRRQEQSGARRRHGVVVDAHGDDQRDRAEHQPEELALELVPGRAVLLVRPDRRRRQHHHQPDQVQDHDQSEQADEQARAPADRLDRSRRRDGARPSDASAVVAGRPRSERCAGVVAAGAASVGAPAVVGRIGGRRARASVGAIGWRRRGAKVVAALGGRSGTSRTTHTPATAARRRPVGPAPRPRPRRRPSGAPRSTATRRHPSREDGLRSRRGLADGDHGPDVGHGVGERRRGRGPCCGRRR